MDPISLALLVSGIGGGLSSIFGGISESQRAAQANALQQQQLADTKLGSTDARGNRTRFIEGVGWVTEYGPTDRALEDYFLNTELPLRQDQFLRADRSSRAEDQTANALLDEFRRIERVDPTEIEQLLFSQASKAVGENSSRANDIIMRNILRTGATNNGRALENVAKSANSALADAAISSKLKALDFADSKYNTDRGNTSSLYNLFANRANQSLDPTTAATAPSTTGVVGSNSGMYQAPVADNGLANAIGGISSAASGALNSYNAYNQNNQTNALLQAFLSGGGGFNLNSGGIFGSINERSRAGTGAF